MCMYTLLRNSPNRQNSATPHSSRKMPFLAASSAASPRFSPRRRLIRLLMPTPRPVDTAIMSICTGNTSDTAVKASAL